MPDNSGSATAPASTGFQSDPAIEALNLNDTAKLAAYKLKARFPYVTFTSGRRNKQEQASAMASNVILNRTWIRETYISGEAIDACQRWVNEHPQRLSKADIANGLKGVLDQFNDMQLSRVSKHLSGDAFDVQPVTKNAEGIKQMLRDLTQAAGGKFLEKEGGLVRWHAQF
jgi:hypothetical protein